MVDVRGVRNLYVMCCLLALAACSNGRGSLDEEQPPSGGAQQGFTVGGTITGLDGNGLVLQLNGGNDLGVSNDGSFTFTAELADAAAYSVTVLTQPSGPSQTCTIDNPSGTIAAANVTNVAVTCATGSFAIGGTVSGLAGSGLVVRNNDGDDLAISGNGPFQFAGLLASGGTYNVTVRTHPTGPAQNCTVNNASGTVSNASVTNIAVACMTDQFTVGGSISGLAQGSSGVVLQLNAGDDLRIRTNGTFAFSAALASGSPYQVTVRTPPSSPAQDCIVTRGVGVVAGQNVADVAISCTTRKFSVGGKVSGLQGDGLVLQKNSADDLAIASNGSYTFETEQESGTTYAVTVRTPPVNPSQTCTIANASGRIGSGDVRDANVTCAVNSFKVGGSVGGLLGTGLVLQNNGGNNLDIGANGGFAFTQDLASGANYNVTVAAQPSNPTQACSVASGSGTVGATDVTSVVVNCSTSDFTVGGNIEGLAGSGLVLQNNGGDDLQVASGGSFTFATAVPSGAPYNVTVAVQPTGPAQSCSVTNGSGIVGSGQVTSVQISCVTTEFSIGFTVAGLSGSGLVLQNNGADDLAIASDGTFKFPTSLPNGAPYNVTVGSQPSQQLCLVSNSVGVVSGADVDTVQVNCVVTPL